jgi:hypothetical protein
VIEREGIGNEICARTLAGHRLPGSIGGEAQMP